MSERPFRGSEARRAGTISRHQLRATCVRIHPDVYLPAEVAEPQLAQRIQAAWLWSQRAGVIAGSAASFLHGARWVDRDSTIEMIHHNARTPAGVIARRDLLLAGESVAMSGLVVTTPARTAFDLGRRGGLAGALVAVDALMAASRLSRDHVADLAKRHGRARGLRQLEQVLELADPGSQSPKESWLRLVLIRAGFPRPETQIAVFDGGGRPFAYLDMGWRELMVAVEYDGDHHRTDRAQYVKDIRRRERLARAGWSIVTVVAEDTANDVIRRVRVAIARSTVR